MQDTGILIGYSHHAGQQVPIYVTPVQRMRQMHIIGRTDMGKSALMEHMVLEHINVGGGVAVIDSHGDLVENILRHADETWEDRLLYFNPANPKAIPAWNVLQHNKGQQPDRIVDDLLCAIMEAIPTGWGHRLATFLRHSMLALTYVPGGSLADVATLFSNNKERRNAIRKRILASNLDNELARRFWNDEYPKYRDDEFAPVQHKLCQLLLSGTLGPMFSQPESRFDFRDIMDEGGRIVLLNLSGLGADLGNLLGRIFVSLFYLAAVGRSDLPPCERKPFHLYIDEAHRFMTASIGDMIAETRKFGCSLCIAHQYLAQWETRQVADALGAVGTTIAFNVMAKDDESVAKFLGGGVDPDELTRLEQREAVVRIGTQVYRIETPFLERPADTGMAERVKQIACQRYCVSPEQIRAARQSAGREPMQGSSKYVAGRGPEKDAPAQEFAYDVF